MNEDQWMYGSIISEKVDMNEQNENEVVVNEEHVDCSWNWIWYDFGCTC